MDNNYEMPKPRTATLSLGDLDVMVIAVIFLQSLLIAWFLFLIAKPQHEALPLFRITMGVAILFAILVPVFILLEGFRYRSIMAAFSIPILLYTLVFPLFNSLISHNNLFLAPAIIIPAILGGIGFGLIGLGAYHLRSGVSKTFVLVTTGITIIFLSSPMILGMFLYVITGNPASFPALFS